MGSISVAKHEAGGSRFRSHRDRGCWFKWCGRMEEVLLKAVTNVAYLGYNWENIIMAEKRNYLLWTVLNYGGSERGAPHMTFRIAISKQSACLIHHLLPLPPSFWRCVDDRCAPHFPGSPLSRWWGGHLFSLRNRIIFLPPLGRFSSSLNTQV